MLEVDAKAILIHPAVFRLGVALSTIVSQDHTI